ncbi:hypothetical protein FSP39_022638 [Pinctada imbricata]|uniref:Uncharacterized protein n=1 Tax=Pinctada imbricata TaxID=66713 RepID=A0AA88YK77_PINIB|nr:hypothetical protein FSP39_022638 [Pinctada imbricata]
MTLVATSVGLLTYFLYKKMKYRSPPGPWSIPLIGHWKCPTPVVVLNNLEVVIEALVKKSADFSSRPRFFTGELFSQNGKGIVFGPYSATWKFHKKVAGKALKYYMHGEKLENMINDVCERIFERMSKEQDPFSVTDYIDKLVIHMLFNMCFARKCDLDDPDVERLLKIDTEVVETFGNGLLEDLVPAMTYVYKTQRCKRVESLLFEALSFLKKELNQHEETFDPNNIRDYTDSLLFAREEAEDKPEEASKLTEVYLVQILNDIFFAGLDTTKMTLDWFICFMIANPDFQEKCFEEIQKAIGKKRHPKATDRPNLCFTEACIMETMRMGSVVGIGVPHATICDTNVGGYDVQKDTMVFINHWALHNDSSYWKDVEKFDPYRYLTKEGKMDMKPENWMPFSAGRRVCLGEPVARTELLLIASNLLQNFRFKAPPGVTHVPGMRCPTQGTELPAFYKVVVERRTQS